MYADLHVHLCLGLCSPLDGLSPIRTECGIGHQSAPDFAAIPIATITVEPSP
jgi:hypothetical protein